MLRDRTAFPECFSPPPGLLARVRWLFLLFALLLAGCLALVLLSQAADWWIRALGGVALLFLAYSWLRLYRRSCSGLAWDLVEALAIYGLGVGLGNGMRALVVIYGGLFFRSLYGSGRSSVGGLLLYLAAFLGASTPALLADSWGSALPALLQLPALAIGAGVMSLLGKTLAKYEALEQRVRERTAELAAVNEALGEQTEQLSTIGDAMLAFLEDGDWRAASACLLRSALRQTRSEYGFVGVVVEGPVLRILAHEGIRWDAHINRAFYEQALRTYHEQGYLEFNRFDNLFGHVITGDQVVLANDPATDPRSGGLPPGHPPLRHFLGVPIHGKTAVVGMIGVANRPGGYTGAEQAQLELLSRAAGVLYDSYRRREHEAKLEAERRQAAEALRESHRRLAAALEEQRRTQQLVIQQERLHALGQMASGIAHDLNNSLAPIVGYSELLLRRPAALDEQTREYVELIHAAGQDAAAVVRRLRGFYRPAEEAGRERLQLDDLATQALGLTQFAWKDQAQARGLVIEIEAALEPIPSISGDEAELREAILNLILNAVDAMPKGGTLTLRTRQEDAQVVLEVGDTGTGMTDEVQRRCLEPFFTTKGEHGTGLGLGLVYGTVQRHGGTLQIASQVGEGTTVSLRLPHSGPAEPRPEAPPDSSDGLRALRILVVEDEPLVRRTITAYLGEDGHSVETATNGREGLEKFRRGRFDLVITDRAMPEIGGDQLAAAIRRLALDQPIIMLTGFGEMMSAVGERPLGVDAVLSKPVTLTALRGVISQVAADRPRLPVL